MATSEDDVDLVESDDYYSWLGLCKEATKEEVNNAYRTLSRMYHPDKHANNIKLREDAQHMFTKIKRAHEVLSDAHKRAIYDTMGVKGLETEGWETVRRTRTPQEIIEEFERLQEEREEQRLQRSTNPKGSIVVGVDASDWFDRYEGLDDYDEHSSFLPHIEINQMSISQSVECPLTPQDSATLTGNLSSQNGTGSGHFNVCMRRVLSTNGWAEIDLGAGNGASVALRGFRNLWRRGYGTMSGSVQIGDRGVIRPLFNTMVATQFDKHLAGRLTWSVGTMSAMNTTLLWDHEGHHVQVSLQLGIPHSLGLLSYSHRFTESDSKIKCSARLGTFGAVLEYGGDKKITRFTRLGASILVGVPHGVTLRIRLHRGAQTLVFPVHLSDNIVPEAVFYGTVVPPLLYLLVKTLVINPFVKQQKDKELKKKKEANAMRMAEKKREAQIAMELMEETVERSLATEDRIGGLVIRKALYGKLHGDDIREHECIVVHRPLQALVKDSTLLLPKNTSLSELPGFYDPCVGEPKELSITYEFRRKLHTAKFAEDDKILIPCRDHLVPTEATQDSD